MNNNNNNLKPATPARMQGPQLSPVSVGPHGDVFVSCTHSSNPAYQYANRHELVHIRVKCLAVALACIDSYNRKNRLP